MGFMPLSPQSFVLLLSLLPFAFHIGVPRSVRGLFLDALGSGRTLMDWNPQCKPKLFDTFAKSQLKAKQEGLIMAEMEDIIVPKFPVTQISGKIIPSEALV
jgi:hypothetical protein